jgi:hypothetical protein
VEKLRLLDANRFSFPISDAFCQIRYSNRTIFTLPSRQTWCLDSWQNIAQTTKGRFLSPMVGNQPALDFRRKIKCRFFWLVFFCVFEIGNISVEFSVNVF